MILNLHKGIFFISPKGFSKSPSFSHYRSTFSRLNSVASLKSELIETLKEDGSATAGNTPTLIEELSKISPTKNPAKSPLLLGDFKQINMAEFNNRIGLDKEGNAMYTLGRMAFNSFQPYELPLSMLQVTNQIEPSDREKYDDGSDCTCSYNLSISFSTKVPYTEPQPFANTEELEKIDSTKTKINGMLLNNAICSPSSKKDSRLDVTFLGGQLMPAQDSSKVEQMLWLETFQKQDAPPPFTVRMQKWVASLMLGMEDAKMIDFKKGIIEYKLRKPPRGYVDILYLDETMRITRGNGKTLVVAVRLQ